MLSAESVINPKGKGLGQKEIPCINYREAIHSPRQQQTLEYALDVINNSPVSPYVKALYLFGSCARGEENAESDVDLLMELPQDFFEKNPHLRRKVVQLRGDVSPLGIFDPEVDLKPVSGDEWMSDKSLFYRNVRKDAKIILWH